MSSLPRIVVLISGRGSNLQALLRAAHDNNLNAQIAGVISNVANAGGLEFAREAGLPHCVLPHRHYGSRAEFEHACAGVIEACGADFVVLSGFMRVLTEEFVNRFLGRMINQHPSLLPAYPGLHTHERALADGVEKHGASIHFVTPELDGGPVIMQAEVEVTTDDTADSLAQRILPLEHRMVVEVVNLLADGRLTMSTHESKTMLDGTAIERPLQLSHQP